MKRVLRKYLSSVLLLCLLIELVPLSLFHSHEDHVSEVGHDVDSIDNTDHHGEYLADNSHDHSSENECDICKIQQSLNNQAYSFGKQVHVFNFTKQSAYFLNAETSVDNHHIRSTPGRAPPTV